MFLPCGCRALAMLSRLPCFCHALAMLLRCSCLALAMLLRSSFHALVFAMFWPCSCMCDVTTRFLLDAGARLIYVFRSSDVMPVDSAVEGGAQPLALDVPSRSRKHPCFRLRHPAQRLVLPCASARARRIRPPCAAARVPLSAE